MVGMGTDPTGREEKAKGTGMKGGPTKMSIIAHERIARQSGTDWQPTEAQEQETVFEWAMLMSRQFPELDLLFHVPNGALRDKVVAAQLKRQGVKPGVPDLILPVPRGGFHGLFIELKRKQGGRLTADQKDWIDRMNDKGYLAIRANGAEEACDFLYKYLSGEL